MRGLLDLIGMQDQGPKTGLLAQPQDDGMGWREALAMGLAGIADIYNPRGNGNSLAMMMGMAQNQRKQRQQLAQQQALQSALFGAPAPGAGDASQPDAPSAQPTGGILANAPQDIKDLAKVDPLGVVSAYIRNRVPEFGWQVGAGGVTPTPGGPNSMEFITGKATGEALGKDKQYVDPARGVQNLPGVVAADAERAGGIEGAKAAAQYPYQIGTIGAQGAQNRQTAGFNAGNDLVTITGPDNRQYQVPRFLVPGMAPAMPNGAPETGPIPSITTAAPQGGPTGPMPKPVEPGQALPPMAPGQMPPPSKLSPAEDKAQGDIGANFATAIKTDLESARNASGLIQQTATLNDLLTRGIITGTGADWRLSFARAANLVGKDNAETIANTEAFKAEMGRNVLALVKNLGAGSGISNADREYAERVAGGNIDLNEASIRRILDIGQRAAAKTVEGYNNRYGAYINSPAVPEGMRGAYTVQLPQLTPVDPNPVNVQGAPAATPTPSTPLKGQVIDGYRFKGGNPADPNSWERK